MRGVNGFPGDEVVQLTTKDGGRLVVRVLLIDGSSKIVAIIGNDGGNSILSGTPDVAKLPIYASCQDCGRLHNTECPRRDDNEDLIVGTSANTLTMHQILEKRKGEVCPGHSKGE